MQQLDAGTLSRGYAEILCADGATALLRLHPGTGGKDAVEEHLYYAVAQHDEVVYVSEESGSASDRFDRLIGGRASETGSGGLGREDFLATMPTHLPMIRGAAFQRLALQVSELSRGGKAAH